MSSLVGDRHSEACPEQPPATSGSKGIADHFLRGVGG